MVGVVVFVGVVALLVVLGAAAAPAMPETAPAVARAPATIVAPSILDIVMLSDLLRSIGCCPGMVDAGAKAARRSRSASPQRCLGIA